MSRAPTTVSPPATHCAHITTLIPHPYIYAPTHPLSIVVGEIVEWWGFALACGTLPAVAFAFYTMAYLTSRAIHYHKWYQEKFEDYPKSRKALYPFVL
mmetsp:Transcript_15575/g.33981  ORF Transcript_15575/g.33981 Transcript_15575/m.33981 type:complete len:98 (+) Transcript_15575:710-1003(+)